MGLPLTSGLDIPDATDVSASESKFRWKQCFHRRASMSHRYALEWKDPLVV
jgi:hypothetical protein